MEEHQVHTKPLMADPQPFLSANKCKLVAEFEEECFKMPNQRVFQFAFGVFVFETKKFEDERIADFLISGDSVLRFRLFALEQYRNFIFRQGRPFVELRVDLAVKLPNRPAARQRFAPVKCARVRVPNAQQPNVMRPGQRKAERRLKRSQSATPPPSRRRKAAAPCGQYECCS